MKTKIKQLAFMAVAFVTSFMVTVTAFAAGGFDVINKNYIGFYKCSAISQPDSYIQIRDDGFCKLWIYEDDNYHYFFSGFSNNGKISLSQPDNFLAFFNSVAVVRKDGTVPQPTQRIENYKASGNVFVEGEASKITIASKQSNLKYILRN